MKNNKILIIIGVIVLNLAAVFMIGQALLGKTSQYDKILAKARELSEKELCSKAIAEYDNAINEKDSLDVRFEMLDTYDKGIQIGEITAIYDVYSFAEEIVESYREEPLAYEKVCDFFMSYGKYEECAELLMKARDLNVTSEKIESLRENIRYQYIQRYSMYENVLPCFDGYYAVSSDGSYSYLDTEARGYSVGAYTYGSSFSEGYAFVKAAHPDGSEKSFIINEQEQREVYLDGVELSSGIGAAIDNKGNTVYLLSCKIGDKYKYYDINGKEAFGEYVFAGRFRNNVAAVKEADNKWKLIDGTGKTITENVFSDVVLNEFDECAAKGIIFAKTGDKYHMYDLNGNQIGDFSCDGAKPFVDDYAAFKSGELWGFVDSTGKIVIEAQYDDAKSFSNSLGAIKTGESWNFINPQNEIIIQETFEDVGYLNDNGICFVKIDGYWSCLEFYYTGK